MTACVQWNGRSGCRAGRDGAGGCVQSCYNRRPSRSRWWRAVWVPVNSVFWLVVFAAAMFGLGWFGIRWLTRRGTAEYRREAEKLDKIASDSISEAALKALPLLSDTALFRSVESSSAENGALHALAPELKKVLQRYETVESNAGSHSAISRSAIASSELNPGYLRIGSVAPGTDVEGEIVVRPGEETIYELYPNELLDPTFGTYRSIYHWILATAEETRSTT